MSASDPAVSSTGARGRAYASTTRCRSENDAPSDVWMSGSATFTMVMSSSSMNVPRETATRVIHLLGSLVSDFVGWSVVWVTGPPYEWTAAVELPTRHHIRSIRPVGAGVGATW